MTTEPNPASIGETIRSNIRFHRKRLGLTIRELGAALEEEGASLSFNSLAQFEAGRRKIFNAWEIVELAIVFGVSPNTMLLPPSSEDQDIELTKSTVVTSKEAWAWASGTLPLPSDSDSTERSFIRIGQFQRNAMPHEYRDLQDVGMLHLTDPALGLRLSEVVRIMIEAITSITVDSDLTEQDVIEWVRLNLLVRDPTVEKQEFVGAAQEMMQRQAHLTDPDQPQEGG